MDNTYKLRDVEFVDLIYGPYPTLNRKTPSPLSAGLKPVETLRRIGAQEKFSNMKHAVAELFEKRTSMIQVKNGQITLMSRKSTTTSRKKSLRRKIVKTQKKEKKATKTLGIVVGIFLLCWLPFFTLNIQNAICMKLNEPSCQVGFLPFFLTTWLGYMNSFMNPIIYTTFNADFRRAFKMVICPWKYRQRLGSRV